MSKVKVLSSSVGEKLNWTYSRGRISGTPPGKFIPKEGANYLIKNTQSIEIADQSSGVKVFGAVGWGSVGAVVAGPVGAVIGGMLGGRGETITFVAKFKNGDTMLGQVPKKIWLKMLADRMS